MDVEVNRAPAYETAGSMMADKIVEHITAIMTMCGGIESISSTKYVRGFGSRLHVTISQFSGIPKDIEAQGVIIKDAIAQLMSVANVARVIVKPSDEELKDLRGAWKIASEDAARANGGSSQNFSSDSGGVK